MARVALAVLLVVVSVLPARTQVHPLVSELLHEWVAAVQAHTPGVMDDAVATIAAWNRSELLLAQPFVLDIGDTVGAPWRSRQLKRKPLPPEDAVAIDGLTLFVKTEAQANDFLKRAALLHTDVVLMAQQFPEAVPPPKRRTRTEDVFVDRPEELVIARGPDGRFANYEFGNLNWEYARGLLDAVTPAPAADTTVALWYRAVMAGFASSYSFGEALPHILHARQLLPDDPGVMFGDAAIQETLASPRIQDYVRVTELPGGQQFLFVTSERGHLERAEGLFRRVLARDPGFAEARIRLARVLTQQGKPEAALAALKAVPAQTDAALSFYIHLIRGDAERALKQYLAAQASYQQALDLFPSAQSARLALGHLARLRADRDGALALLQPALTAPPPRDDDPWWEYHRGDGRNAEVLFRQLRAPFLDRAPK